MNEQPTVFVVDDDEQARKSVATLVRSMDINAETFATAEAFLSAYHVRRPGCLVTDLRMFGMSGIELQDRLNEMGALLPVIVLTAYACTPVTVRAMRAGAITMLDKPYDDDQLWDAVCRALTIDQQKRAASSYRDDIRRRIQQLTDSERNVLELVVTGTPNKDIADALNVSVRTVENRRREVFTKMQADSVAQLVRLVLDANETQVAEATT